MPKGAKMIPYLRTENLKNHTLSRGTYLYSPYMGVPPRGNHQGMALELMDEVVSSFTSQNKSISQDLKMTLQVTFKQAMEVIRASIFARKLPTNS